MQPLTSPTFKEAEMADATVVPVAPLWKPVPTFEGIYEVSSLGEVRRICGGAGRAKAGHTLRQASNAKGYRYVCLCKGGEQTTAYVHVLVCRVFHGEKPTASHQAAHRDDDKSNNTDANLYWATGHQNHADRRRNGGILSGSRIGLSKLHERDIPEIIAMREAGMLHREIALRFGVAPHTISRIVSGSRWGHMQATEG